MRWDFNRLRCSFDVNGEPPHRLWVQQTVKVQRRARPRVTMHLRPMTRRADTAGLDALDGNIDALELDPLLADLDEYGHDASAASNAHDASTTDGAPTPSTSAAGGKRQKKKKKGDGGAAQQPVDKKLLMVALVPPAQLKDARNIPAMCRGERMAHAKLSCAMDGVITYGLMWRVTKHMFSRSSEYHMPAAVRHLCNKPGVPAQLLALECVTREIERGAQCAV